MLPYLSALLAGKGAAVATGVVIASAAVTGATGNLPGPAQETLDSLTERAVPAEEQPPEAGTTDPQPPAEAEAQVENFGAEDVEAEDVEAEGETEDPDSFGAKRSAQVKQAREAGQHPGPAWAHPEHPVFGDDGPKAGQVPGLKGRARAAEARAEADDAEDEAEVEVEVDDGGEDPDSFGAKRSAQVKEAREAGQHPGPAWAHPDHPVFGDDGPKAGQVPGQKGRARAAEARAEAGP